MLVFLGNVVFCKAGPETFGVNCYVFQLLCADPVGLYS
jgi:hypothetical protein